MEMIESTDSQLARELPRRRGNRPVHVSTIHRWRSRGLRGIQLEAVRLGGAWCTTWKAFRRFCQQLTEAETKTARLSEINTNSKSSNQRGENSERVRKGNTSAQPSHHHAETLLDQDGW